MSDVPFPSETLLATRFRLGSADFGLEARLVQEVVKPGDVTVVHGAPSVVVGIRNLRGRIVTVIDLATHLGLGAVQRGPEARLLIMERHGDSWGFLVDAVVDAFELQTSGLTPPPANLWPQLRGSLLGVWRQNDNLTALLDVEALFRWDEDGNA